MLEQSSDRDRYLEDVNADQHFNWCVLGDSTGNLTIGVFFISRLNRINQEGALGMDSRE